ncbi:LAFE_0H01904g1_1 [Lachancea fermentati]|uniref:LAFE_0H01904g1_1 n=1 Tax=Lachancea fermentati TaxID=4955 RepID=A0A1G4MJ68_LACFM|nr:LAFE_0H01904g1_1 [Lachancea fermentati]
MSSHVFQPTDIVLAKVKGFPAWPAMIIPEEIVPANVLKGRTTRPRPEQDEDEDDDDEDSNYIVYSDLLRFRKYNSVQPSYCVKFFCDDSYIWLKPSDFKLLSPAQCDEWLNSSKKKNRRLVPAYEMARRGPEGIDIWEFVEYGTNGKPDEEEYVEDEGPDAPDAPVDEIEDSGDVDEDDIDENDTSFTSDSDFDERPRKRASRRRASSPPKRPRRAAAKRSTTRTTPRRSTRSGDRKAKDEDEEAEEALELPEPPKSKSRQKKKKPQVDKYKFEDDEDWLIVGLGPQEPSLTSGNTLVSKLSQKKNLEIHNELKADLEEKLIFVNKLLVSMTVTPQKEQNVDDYHVLIDELEQCLSLKGSQDEMVTVFLGDHELLLNLRVFFNLKYAELESLGLWVRFQDWFSNVYRGEFFPDDISWSTIPTSEPESAANGKEELTNGKKA